MEKYAVIPAGDVAICNTRPNAMMNSNAGDRIVDIRILKIRAGSRSYLDSFPRVPGLNASNVTG
jgi:hypothetical protein